MAQWMIALVFFLTLCGSAQAWDEPDSFMGIKFWKPLNESIPACPNKNYPYSPDRSKCWTQDIGRPMIQNAKIDDRLVYFFVDLVDNSVASLDAYFHSSNFLKFAGIFKERYGAPTQTGSNQLKNLAGASFSSQVLLWKGKRLSISIQERGGLEKLDQGVISVWTDTWDQFVARSNAQNRKKAAKDL